MLTKAPEQTLAQLRASLARARIAVDPDGAAARHQQARRGRRVVLGPDDDGMASLWALLPAPDAYSAYQWLTRLARGLGSHDPRGMDARRADLLHDLLTGRLTITPPDVRTDADNDADTHDDTSADTAATDDPTDGDTSSGSDTSPESAAGSTPAPASARLPTPVTPGKPLVHVIVDHGTLTGADDRPAELTGYGPIPAELAREIAADAVWKRLVTDPLSGALLDHGRTTYHPPAALADFVRARDVTCRFPTCRRRALDLDLDHTRDWAHHGTTGEDNLYGACLHHHRLKHHAGWTVTQHLNGQITWTTPTGHSYTSDPHDYRAEPRSDRSAGTPPAGPAPPDPHRAVELPDEPPF